MTKAFGGHLLGDHCGHGLKAVTLTRGMLNQGWTVGEGTVPTQGWGRVGGGGSGLFLRFVVVATLWVAGLVYTTSEASFYVVCAGRPEGPPWTWVLM